VDGGGSPGCYCHHFWRYDPGTNVWQTLPLPSGFHSELVSGVIRGQFYLAAGLAYRDNLTLEVYDPPSDNWLTKAPLPAAEDHAVSGVIDGKLYITAGAAGGPWNTLRVYNPVTNAWRTAAMMPTERTFAAGAVAKRQFFVISGQASAGGYSNKVEAYTPCLRQPFPNPC